MVHQEQVWLLPNSFALADPHARIVRDALRVAGVRARILTPRSPTGSLLQSATSWTRKASDDWSGRIDRRLLERRTHGVITIDRSRRKGPFPLDLAARFLHPLDRMRLLASDDRSRIIADIASVAPIGAWTIAMPLGNSTLWLWTADVVVAELWSLVLAETLFDQALEMRGPWEDPAMQRAAELDLGVRVPSDIQMTVERVPSLPGEVIQLIERGRRRLGMASPVQR